MPSESSTFILVGHCGPDVFMLRNAIRRHVPEAAVETVNDDESLQPSRGGGGSAVLLVNRQLDGAFATMTGVELIRRLVASGDARPAMLVSNFADAQRQAVEAGALPGFGKSGLYDAETGERLRAAIGRGPREDTSRAAG